MAQVQIRPSVSEYQELLYVCLHEYEQQRRRDRAGTSWDQIHPEHKVHTFLDFTCLLFTTEMFFCALHVLKCLPQAYSNQPAPKRSFTTAHRNISSSFATNALNPIKCLHTLPNTHQNAQIATCCLSSLCHDGVSANRNQCRQLSPTLRQWGFKIAHWLDKLCVCISECMLMHEQPGRTAQKGELYFWLP